MKRTKNIKIQVWLDSNYCRTIGIWYKPIAPTSTLDGTAPIEPPYPDPIAPPPADDELIVLEIEQDEDAPYLVVTTSMFELRKEVMGGNPVAIGQSPMPKEFLETTIRNMSQLFANEVSMFQPKTKALAKSFLASQTINHTLVKEESMTVSPIQGEQSLDDLSDFLNQYTKEERENIRVVNVTEKPETAAGKKVEDFLFDDKQDGQTVYITVTKLADIYGTEDPYIKMTTMPDPMSTITPGTETAPASIAIIALAEDAIEADNIEREALETFDNMVEDGAPMDADMNINDDEVVDGIEDDVSNEEEIPPTRVEVLEQLLKNKNQQLIDAGIIPPVIPETETTSVVETVPTEISIDDEYEAMMQPPTDIDDGMPTP